MIQFGVRGKTEEAHAEAVRGIRARLGTRSIVLVGMPGSGKSAVGRRLAARLELPFVDADEEIERAAGKPITDIFKDHGEPYFRDGERKVIARLLRAGPQVLATGGGAFMVAETQENIRRSRHLGVAQGGAGAAPAPRAQEKQPPAAGRTTPKASCAS